jgi:hypothetical protein
VKDTDSNQKEPIQDLLAAKQKEKPGDEFFENFSDQILTRLEEPAPKPTLWDRLNENVDPFRAAAALFAVAVGCALIIGLDEGSTIAESEPIPLGQAEQELMADVSPPSPSPAPLGQAQGTLAGVGKAPPKKVKPQPPLMLLKPGTGLKIDSANYKNGAEIKDRN